MTQQQDKNRIELGVITGPHGIRGEVTIKPFTETPLDQFHALTDETGTTPITIKKLRAASKGRLIATLAGLTNRNQAEELKGTILTIARDELPDLQEDEFYYSDLLGLEARLQSGEIYGRVLNIANHGAGDLLEILPQNSQTSMYLLFTRETVPSLSIDKGYITINLPGEIVVNAPNNKSETD